MKALVDSLSGSIRGVFQEPLTFDVSGRYIIDIPDVIGSAIPTNDPSAVNLVTAKNQAWAKFSEVPGTLVFDEFLAAPNIDTTNSIGVEVGPNKRTVIYPNGTLLTNPIAGPSAIRATFLHYYGFSLYRSPIDPASLPNSDLGSATPGPSKMLYGFNPSTSAFEKFSNATFTVSVCQAGSPFTNIITPVPDLQGGSAVAFPASFRLKFVNTSSIPYHLSDWVLVIHS